MYLFKFSEIRATRWLFWHSDFTKLNFGRGYAPDPAGGAYDAPTDPLVGWGGGYLRRRGSMPDPLKFTTWQGVVADARWHRAADRSGRSV